MDTKTPKNIGERLKKLGSVIEGEPVILLKGDGGIWISDEAKKIISDKAVNTDDFLSWLKIGAQHLKNAIYCTIETVMMRLPDNSNDVLVILTKECSKKGYDVKLTSREKWILEHLVKGMSNKEIASSLDLSPETVNTHLDRIYRKLKVSNRLSASIAALKHGIIVKRDADRSKAALSGTF